MTSPAVSKEGPLKMNEVLFNDVLTYLDGLKVGWRPDIVDSVGKRFVSVLQRTLWYLDAHHQKLADRAVHLPPRLLKFTGYDDFRSKKKKPPRLTTKGLNEHIEGLCAFLLEPWLNRSCNRYFLLYS